MPRTLRYRSRGQVNGEFYENMNVDKLKELLATLK